MTSGALAPRIWLMSTKPVAIAAMTATIDDDQDEDDGSHVAAPLFSPFGYVGPTLLITQIMVASVAAVSDARVNVDETGPSG